MCHLIYLQQVDKVTITKLVEAYDGLNKQEEEYIQVIRELIQQKVVQYTNEVKKDKTAAGNFDFLVLITLI